MYVNKLLYLCKRLFHPKKIDLNIIVYYMYVNKLDHVKKKFAEKLT